MEEIKRFMGFDNPNQERYETLSRGQNKDHLYAACSDRLEKNFNVTSVKEELKKSIPRSTVVDLGAGPQSYGNVLYAARVLSARAYIGIDTALPADSPIREIDGIKEILVRDDMLLGLSRVNTESANITINGIDWMWGGKYVEAIANEIERTVKPGGIVFGIGSEGFSQKILPSRKCFERVELTSDKEHILSSDFFLFKKN